MCIWQTVKQCYNLPSAQEKTNWNTPKDPLKRENTRGTAEWHTTDGLIRPWNNSQQTDITAFSVCKAVHTLYGTYTVNSLTPHSLHYQLHISFHSQPHLGGTRFRCWFHYQVLTSVSTINKTPFRYQFNINLHYHVSNILPFSHRRHNLKPKSLNQQLGNLQSFPLKGYKTDFSS